ncbi:hypothetical protein DIZ81_01425 [Legionella taurinensis]|uniref:Uncharacterized protein n=1 Tax=Legionella taurinensis TaxID=70611 RepID=A0A3A5L7I1_9GAMM|nr:hypothetical protein DB744_01430 [Legionella taurinensis]PUT45624.1 hypothetical protein DB746_01430 [Legionella taurinensis]PUT49393.1 hypothetical protein DB745_01430 [Legionella taurinensis]RJT49247.1 hypothetical protein D6J04_00935 [Legionella taurinensis]TID38899.1 hypothetical protein DIZ42_01430 [Legionella taurinensis]
MQHPKGDWLRGKEVLLLQTKEGRPIDWAFPGCKFSLIFAHFDFKKYKLKEDFPLYQQVVN